MKMQNVEMEFVTFDAQDVITTSGQVYFSASVNSYDDTPLNQLLTGDPASYASLNEDNTMFLESKSGKDLTGDWNWYKINGATKRTEDDSLYYTIDADGIMDKPKTGDFKTTLKEIISWLGANAQ